jgi:uncharacterized protein (DUF433 family)
MSLKEVSAMPQVRDGSGDSHPGVDALCNNCRMGSVSVLDRDMYTEAEAARLLGMHQPTLHYWLEGKKYRGRTYEPVIREKATGKKAVTWAEFVEAGLLCQYRKKNVPLDEMRQFIKYLRDKFGVAYPLAHERPWMAGKKLVIEAQEYVKLPREFWLFAPVGEQPLLLPPGQLFMDHVEFKHGVVDVWHPAGPASPVVIDPEQRSGRPSVDGISTSVIFEYSEGGASHSEIAEDFGIPVRHVRMAIAYELTRGKAA